MKHITFADKSLLIGDEAADVILAYAAALAASGSAATVTVHAVSSDGDEVDATFLLGAGAPMMAETTHSTLPEPDNSATIAEIQAKLDVLVQPEEVAYETPSEGILYTDEHDEFR
jgi:hypothetical protein